jgi:hypothetical protein
MKKLLASLLIMGISVNCHQPAIDPSQEVAATIVDLLLDPTVYCLCCQGYRVHIGKLEYFTNRVPSPFDKPNTAVLIRYKQPEEECSAAKQTNRIQIISIRTR